MPRKPTLLAREARARLIDSVAQMPSNDALPTLEILGTKYDLHPSTVFRILRDLETEGIVWQSPGGKFYPSAARAERVRGMPVCFIGREMWHWSRLYQEILEGVSEVCSSNGSPLVLLSAPSLVRQTDPTQPPKFALAATQRKELEVLLPSIPRNCGGLLFDHLWKDEALSLPSVPSGPKAQLLYGSGKLMPLAAPDYVSAAQHAANFVNLHGAEKVLVVSPFQGDPALDASIKLLLSRLNLTRAEEISFGESQKKLPFLAKKATRCRTALICPEDNTAKALFDELLTIRKPDQNISILAIQGTGLLHAPANRLRFDFRRLGKSVASRLLHGTQFKRVSPVVLLSSA